MRAPKALPKSFRSHTAKQKAVLKIERIASAAQRVIMLLKDYKGGKVGTREMLLDPILYGYLEGAFKYFTRQHYVWMGSSARPKRIDFRRGTSNPVVIEFAVRPPSGGGTLSGSQNHSELLKLCRVPTTQARLRVLLLMDLNSTPISEKKLRLTYRSKRPGPGRFERFSVRVLYVHRENWFDFVWRP